jgi:hypothetical protein
LETRVSNPAPERGMMLPMSTNGITTRDKKMPLEAYVLAHACGRLVVGAAWQEDEWQPIPPTIDLTGPHLHRAPLVLFPAYDLRVDLVRNGPGIAQNFQVLPLFNLLNPGSVRVLPDDWRMSIMHCTGEERRVLAAQLENVQVLVADMRASHERATAEGGGGGAPRIIVPGR